MNLLEAIILGLIQGLTELIPVSSSGHLVIAQYLFGGAGDHLFLEWINIGTVVALLIFFRRRLIAIVRRVYRERDLRLAGAIMMAALPAGIVGFVLADFIKTTWFFTSVWVVAIMLIVIGGIMVVLERLPRLPALDDLSRLSLPRSLAVGLAQVLALIPGTSRSGSTIIAGRLVGLSPAQAAEFSFLVSIPIMLGVILKLALSAADRSYLMDHLPALVWGNLAALVSGLVAVGFLMRYLQRHGLTLFGWYRIALGALIMTILLVQ